MSVVVLLISVILGALLMTFSLIWVTRWSHIWVVRWSDKPNATQAERKHQALSQSAYLLFNDLLRVGEDLESNILTKESRKDIQEWMNRYRKEIDV